MQGIILSVLAVFVFWAGPLTAAEKHFFTVGGEIYDYSYKEPGLMKNEGSFAALVGRYEFHSQGEKPDKTGLMLGFEGRMGRGVIDYSSRDTGNMYDIENYLYETRAEAGLDIRAGGRAVLTPFFGFGYRYLNDDKAGETTTTGACGYERRSNYYYSPIGMQLAIGLEKGWTISLGGEYDIFWDGRQESLLGDSNCYLSYKGDRYKLGNTTNDQDSGYGYALRLQARKRFNSFFALGFEAFFRYWDIDDSDFEYAFTASDGVIVYLYEPANTTRETGMRLVVDF